MGIGRRVLELACLRDKSSRRETRILGILQFIQSTIWKMLFGAAADSLEKAVDKVRHARRRDSQGQAQSLPSRTTGRLVTSCATPGAG